MSTRLLIVAVPALLVLAVVVTGRKAGEDWEGIIFAIPNAVGILLAAFFLFVIPVVIVPLTLIFFAINWVLYGTAFPQ